MKISIQSKIVDIYSIAWRWIKCECSIRIWNVWPVSLIYTCDCYMDLNEIVWDQWICQAEKSGYGDHRQKDKAVVNHYKNGKRSQEIREMNFYQRGKNSTMGRQRLGKKNEFWVCRYVRCNISSIQNNLKQDPIVICIKAYE